MGCCQNLSCMFFGIVGQKGKKWVKLGKIAVFMLKHIGGGGTQWKGGYGDVRPR